jgi:hypothetical protein
VTLHEELLPSDENERMIMYRGVQRNGKESVMAILKYLGIRQEGIMKVMKVVSDVMCFPFGFPTGYVLYCTIPYLVSGPI